MNNRSWTIRCQECEFTWRLAGHWSHYEREAIESRPCPSCGAYALSSPEPRAGEVRTWRGMMQREPHNAG